MKKVIFYLAVVAIHFQCARPHASLLRGGNIEREGFIDCFEPNTQVGGKELWCEASAVLFDGKNVFLANDKNMPEPASAVFFWASRDALLDSTQKPTYLQNELLRNAQKYEDFALAPDRKHAFLTTGFDRIKPDKDEWDGFSTLVYWNITNDLKNIHPQAAHLKAGEVFSVALRQKLSQTLRSEKYPDGAPYFKIEGIAATDSNLFFGVREEGRTFSDFEYKVKIVGVSYAFVQDSLTIQNDFRIVADCDVAALQPNLPKPLAISSIEFDPTRNLFWILTSYEKNDQVGAYLWWATANDLKTGKLNLVKNRATNQPLALTHKAEDLTILDDKRLLIIHDDDRVKTTVGTQTRQPHQTAYSLLSF